MPSRCFGTSFSAILTLHSMSLSIPHSRFLDLDLYRHLSLYTDLYRSIQINHSFFTLYSLYRSISITALFTEAGVTSVHITGIAVSTVFTSTSSIYLAVNVISSSVDCALTHTDHPYTSLWLSLLFTETVHQRSFTGIIRCMQSENRLLLSLFTVHAR